MNLEPELVSSSQCHCTLDFHIEVFGLYVWVQLSSPEKGTNFINAENHCYLLILICSIGNDNQKLIKNCVLYNGRTGKVFNGHKTLHKDWTPHLGLLGIAPVGWRALTFISQVNESTDRAAAGDAGRFLSSSGPILLWAQFSSGILVVDSGNWSKWDVKSENVQLNSLESNRTPILLCLLL